MKNYQNYNIHYINKLINEIRDELNLPYTPKIKLNSPKRKVASISLTKQIIYLNKNILPLLTEEEIKFILTHELLHLKYGKYHINPFEDELKKLFPNKEMIILNIIKKFESIPKSK